MTARKARPRKAPTAQQRLAAADGTVVMLDACCRVKLTLGPTRFRAAHDPGCPALEEDTVAGMMARLQAAQAIGAVLSERGIQSIPMVIM